MSSTNCIKELGLVVPILFSHKNNPPNNSDGSLEYLAKDYGKVVHWSLRPNPGAPILLYKPLRPAAGSFHTS